MMANVECSSLSSFIKKLAAPRGDHPDGKTAGAGENSTRRG